MTRAPVLRKFTLTLHVVASISWIGIVAGFLALAIVGVLGSDAQEVHASYIAMDLTYRMVVVPLGVTSLITGIISSLSTEWGLVRHYWVVVKLLLTVPAVGLMFVHVDPVAYAARFAVTTTSAGDLYALRIQLVVYAVSALLVLLTATVLSTYKPRGRTPYGVRRLSRRALRIGCNPSD